MMNNYLIIRFKNKSKSVDYPSSLFEQYLVDKPSKTKVWHSPDKNTYLYSFLVNHKINRRPYYADENAAISFDGLPLLRDFIGVSEHYHRDIFVQAKQHGFDFIHQLYGEFSLAFIEKDNVLATTNLGGSHMVYYLDHPDFVVITNRAPLILAIPQVSCELSTEASCSVCYQGYISDGMTPFKNILKLMPGSTLEIDHDGVLRIHPHKYTDLIDMSVADGYRSNPKGQFEKISDSIIQYLLLLQTYYEQLPFTVPLSGGKDSRLILALLLKAGLKDKLDSIWTRGPLYSPDVISAQDLCRTIGHDDHKIHRPAVISSNQVNVRIICNTLNYHEGNLSLYDLQGISNNHFITASGHQNALRPGSFSSCRTDKLDNFVNDSLDVRFHDPLSVLTDEYRDATCARYVDFFYACCDEGAPLDDLGDLYYLRQRNPNWVAVFCNSDYYSGPYVNPLLMGDIYQFIFSVPKYVREYELLHFMCMRYCEPDLLSIPFANQSWREDMGKVIGSLGVEMDFNVPLPYKSHVSFPNMANPYITSVKIDYVNALAPAILRLLEKHRNYYSEFMRITKFVEIVKDNKDIPFSELYCILGIYANVLIKEYAPGIFRRDDRQAIIEDIQSMMVTETTCIPLKVANPLKMEPVYEDIVERHEKCISQLSRQIQKLNNEGIQRRTPTVEHPDRSSHMKASGSSIPKELSGTLSPEHKPWRHVYITNETTEALNIFMIIGDEEDGKYRKTPFKKLAPQEELKYGFQEEYGEIKLYIIDTASPDQEEHLVETIPIRLKQFKYDINIDASC